MSVLGATGGCEYTLGVLPGYIFITTNDIYDQIQTIGYLNGVTPTGVGFLDTSPGFMDGQFVFVSTTDKKDVLMKVSIDGSSNINLVPFTTAFYYKFITPTFSSVTTATQLSATRNASVSYSFSGTITISVLGGQSITANLKYADNVGMSTNVVTLDTSITSNSGVLGLSQTNSLKLNGIIPAGKYRQVTFSVTGSATAPSSIASSQEVLL